MKRTHQVTPTDIDRVVAIVRTVRMKVIDGSDVLWAGYDSPEQLRAELDDELALLLTGDQAALEKIGTRFLPTCSFQELSLSNGWADEYLELASEFDRLYARIKSSNV